MSDLSYLNFVTRKVKQKADRILKQTDPNDKGGIVFLDVMCFLTMCEADEDYKKARFDTYDHIRKQLKDMGIYEQTMQAIQNDLDAYSDAYITAMLKH